MTPTRFSQANTTFVPPEDLDESQCGTIPAYYGEVKGGNLDGIRAIVVAWQPTPEEREKLSQGASVFITFLGGLPAHTVTTEFPQ